MKVYYCNTYENGNTNFGDVLTPFILEKLGIDSVFCNKNDNPHFIGIGSILNNDVEENYNYYTWSTGSLLNPGKKFNPVYAPHAVRGKLTLNLFTNSENTVLGDGGLIVSEVYPYEETVKQYKLGVILHYIDIKYNDIKQWKLFNNQDVLFIDVKDPVEKIINDVWSCEKIVSTSLHGVVICDSYGIDHSLVNSYLTNTYIHKVQNSYKYHDYYSAFNLDFKLPSLTIGKDTTMLECINECKPVNKPNIQEIKNGLLSSLKNIISRENY